MRFQRGFEARFERVRDGYRDVLDAGAGAPPRVRGSASCGFVLASFALVPFLGRNFFPAVDGGQILMHVRAPVGTRVEETAALFARRPAGDPRDRSARRDLGAIVDNIGLPTSSINLTYNNTGTIGAQDGDIQICAARRPSADRGLRASGCARNCRGGSPARRSRSRRPTSSARS